MGEVVNLTKYREARESEARAATEEDLETLRRILSEIIESLPEEPGAYYISTDELAGDDPFILPQTIPNGYEDPK